MSMKIITSNVSVGRDEADRRYESTLRPSFFHPPKSNYSSFKPYALELPHSRGAAPDTYQQGNPRFRLNRSRNHETTKPREILFNDVIYKYSHEDIKDLVEGTRSADEILSVEDQKRLGAPLYPYFFL